MTDKMQIAIEYRDLLKEILELEGKVLGNLAQKEEQQQTEKTVDPKQEEQKPKGGPRIKVDRGKVLALKRAGWTNRDIARDLQCSELTVGKVIREATEEGKQ